MSKTVYIAPSILAADPGRYEEEIQNVEAAGADWVHIDVMDGSFVPPITFGDNIVATAKKCSSLFTDVHLMIVNPDRHIDAFATAGSDRIIVHQETCSHLHRTLQSIKAKNVSPGVAINPGTPVDTIFPVLELCDLVLVMTVNPGWGGQAFIPSCLSKIEQLHEEIINRSLDTIIEVDGGINDQTGAQCRAAGATALVAGSYIMNQSDRKSAIESLRP